MSTNSRVKIRQYNPQTDFAIAYPSTAISKKKKSAPNYSNMYKIISAIGIPINLFDLKRFYNLY